MSGENLSLVLQQVMVVGVLAIGQTLIILTAGIDLSCGMVMALGGIIMTKFATDYGLNPYFAIACGLAATTLFGLVNGLSITRIKLPPFIVTLGTLKIGIRSMTQAVAVARSAAFAQHVVIMDEPTAALGVKEGNMVLDLIRRMRDKGLPVSLISHNMPHVFEVADRIHIQHLGKRAAVVDPKKISMSDTVAIMTGAKPVSDIPQDCLA